MGKASKRLHALQPGPATAHERILAEAKAGRESAAGFALCDATETPALAALLESAREAVGAATPTRFIHEGRPYWLRVSIGMAHLEVFDVPASGSPLITALAGSTDRFGHTPGH